MSKNVAVAAESVQRVASLDSPQMAQFAAVLFADYLGETEPDFDPDAFLRTCGMPEAFIERMAKARAKAERRTMNQAWREASRIVKARGVVKVRSASR